MTSSVATSRSSTRPGLVGAGRRVWAAYRADVLAVAALWAGSLLFLCRLFVPIAALRLYVVQGDFSNQFYPFRVFAANEWRAGRVPLWNPYVFAGHPFLADIQTGVFYPLSFLTSVGGALLGLPYQLLEWELALHYPLAATCAYLLGRRLLGSRLGALTTALVFTLSGFLTSYPAQQLAMLEAAVWLPLVLLLLELGVARPTRRGAWVVGAGLALAVCLLAGHTQTALFVGYTAAGYWIWRGVRWRRPVRELALGLMLYNAIGLGVAAVVALPALELLRESVRANLGYEAAAYGFERRALLGVLLPLWRGEQSLYVGVLTLLLALPVAVGAWLPAGWAGRLLPAVESGVGLDRSGARFWGLLAGVGLLLSVGGRGPLFPVLYRVAPGFTLFRDQERAVYLFALAVAVLAGAGAARLAAAVGAGRWRPSWWYLAGPAGLAMLAGAAVAALAAWSDTGADPKGTLAGCAAYFGGWLLVACFVVAWLRCRPAGWLVRGVLLAVVAGDLCAINLGNNLGPVKPDPTPRYQDIVAQLKPSVSEFRVRGESDEVFPPNYAAVWKMPTISGDTPFLVSRVTGLLYAENAEWRRWQALNVKYFLSRQGPFEGIELAFTSGDINVYRVVFSLPRTWAVRAYRVAADPADALRQTVDPANHPGEVVILEAEPGVGPIVPGARPDVRVVSYRSQRIELDTSGDGAAILVLADTWYPGWRAYVDGRETPVLRANYVTRAVALPAGEHRVEFVFVPLGFWAGLVVSVLTVAGAGLYLARAARR